MSILSLDKDGIVVSVTSARGRSRKTTFSLLLATVLAKSSAKAVEKGLNKRSLDVCVLDMDLLELDMGFLIDQMNPNVLNIALSGSVFDAKLVKDNLIYQEAMGIHAMLGPVDADVHYLTPAFYQKLIGILRTMFDVVIIGTSPNIHDDFVQTAIRESDAVLIITNPDIKSIKALARWINIAGTPLEDGDGGIDKTKIGIVVNGFIQGIGLNEEMTAAAQGVKLLATIPLDKVIQWVGGSRRLEDIAGHPAIGPIYYNLAQRIAKAVNGEMVPLIEVGSDNRNSKDNKP